MEFPITVECYVGARHSTAHEECREPLEYKYNAYASWGLQDRSAQSSFEDFARDRFIIGDKVSVKEEIARYRELLGVDHFIMRCQWPGLPQERVLSSIRRLGEIFAAYGFASILVMPAKAGIQGQCSECCLDSRLRGSDDAAVRYGCDIRRFAQCGAFSSAPHDA